MSQVRTFIDQLDRKVQITFPPRRIISLVPSQTELLFHLGLDEEVVGITKFCVHPETQFRQKPRVGGTKNVHLDRVQALKPDLIIANQEENQKEQIEALSQEYPVWISDVRTLEDAMQMILQIGQITDRQDAAENLERQLKEKFDQLKQIAQLPQLKVAYFIWNDPLMVAGAGTFIHEMLGLAGYQNVFGTLARYPEVTPQQLQDANPDAILLSSEPFPFKEKHLEAFRRLCPRAKVQLVDGELFSWYGSRLLLSPDYFVNLRKELGT
jgi:ABC-type Fe3+-hydroxamate transport system substrate-binding protein